MAGLTQDEFVAWVAASCQRSGVPLRIADSVAIHGVVVLLQGRDSRRAAQRLAADRTGSDPPDQIDSGRIDFTFAPPVSG